MKKIFIILELLFITFVCGAQVSDDFTDGDLTNNPIWTTDQSAKWTVINGQLRSNSSAANSTFYITTHSAKATNAQWEFLVNLQFNTSSANFVDVYLMSEQSNLLSGTNNGYFVRLGGTPDDISFYKLTAGTATLLINGVDGVTNSSNNIDLNNPCGEEENWEASEDAKGGTPGKTNSVNANKPDLTGPKLVSVAAIQANELLLVFNEKLEKPLSITLFSFEPSIEISTAVFTSQSLKEVKLTLSENLAPRQLYTVAITNLRDCSGNFIKEAFNSLSFALPELAEAGDLLLNEILSNLRPGGVDFIEIVNVSEKYLNLKNWSLANILEGSATAMMVAKPAGAITLFGWRCFP